MPKTCGGRSVLALLRDLAGPVVALSLLLLPLDLSAAPPPVVVRTARERFERGNRRYNEGRYAEALHLYQAAYDLLPSPEILFNLALAREKTLDYEGCALGMRDFLKQAGSPEWERRARERFEHCRGRAVVPVKVSSFPPSAAVYVGAGAAKALRGRTPARLDLAPGVYAVSVELPGYQHAARKVTVEIGERPDVDFVLERLSSLRVEADVAGARVYLDDEPAGETPLVREVGAGVYRVDVRKEGYRKVVREVRVAAGDQVSLLLSLPREPRLLVLRSGLAAEASVDGRQAGRTPLERRLPPGPHDLEVTAPGHVPLVTRIHVADDSDLRARAELTPLRSRLNRAAVGTLAGVTGAAALGAVVFGALALSDQSTYDEGVPTRALLDRTEARALTTDVLWATAAAFAAATVAYYLLTRPKPSRLVVERPGGGS